MTGTPQQQAAEHSEQPQGGGGWLQGVGSAGIAQVGVATCDVLLAHVVVLGVIHAV